MRRLDQIICRFYDSLRVAWGGVPSMADSLFQRYGGFGPISRLVLDFYEHVLDSDVVGHHFDGIDMPRLIDHQTRFIASLMGGPGATSDERLGAAHHALNIAHDEFDEILTILGDTLRRGGVTEDDIATLLRGMESKRRLIVRRSAA